MFIATLSSSSFSNILTKLSEMTQSESTKQMHGVLQLSTASCLNLPKFRSLQVKQLICLLLFL